MTKLGRHIDVIMVRPVMPHIAGIVVGMDVHIGILPEKLVSIATLSMSSSKDSVNVEILFVEGVIDDHVQLVTGMTACSIALPGKTDDSVYRG